MKSNHYRHGKQTAAFTAALRTSNAVTTLTAHAFAAPVVGIRSDTAEPLPMPFAPKPARVFLLPATVPARPEPIRQFVGVRRVIPSGDVLRLGAHSMSTMRASSNTGKDTPRSGWEAHAAAVLLQATARHDERVHAVAGGL